MEKAYDYESRDGLRDNGRLITRINRISWVLILNKLKTCSKCLLSKDISNFHKNKNAKDGLSVCQTGYYYYKGVKMTINETRAEIKTLEANITELIAKFNDKTDVPVVGIDLNITKVFCRREVDTYTYDVKMEIKL